jgi:hypothetical protein
MMSINENQWSEIVDSAKQERAEYLASLSKTIRAFFSNLFVSELRVTRDRALNLLKTA